MSVNKVTLIVGGGRSGKSTQALHLAQSHAGKKVFIATAEAFDDEMRLRISKHQSERGDNFQTVEEPLDPARALAELPKDTEVAVVDCLTVWLGNLMHMHGVSGDYPEVNRLLQALKVPSCEIILVTNEVGMGIIPDNEMSRTFRDLAGRLNQNIAAVADRVLLMVCGLPVVVKGENI